MEPIKLTAEVTLDDHRDFVLQHTRRRRIFSRVLVFALSGAVIWKHYSTSPDPSPLFGLSFFAIILAVLYAGTLYEKHRIAQSYRQNKSLGEPTSITIDEAGIETQSSGGSYAVKWSDIRRVVENKNSFFFYITQNQALILPKRSLGGEGQEKLGRILTAIRA